MKLQFDANLHYQEQAVSAVVDLFRGQTPRQSVFTVTTNNEPGQLTTDNGIGNKLELVDEEILENLQAVQLRNGLPQTKTLKKGAYDFDIEMETGTGKTYVYLRTIFELNKAYGFKKFIIVVPSIAIKEGVAKSLEITKEHFKTIYNNVVYDSYIYDGSKPEEVRSFAVNDNISIMVINIAAFRKSFNDPEKENKANIIHRAIDKLNGMRPINLIQETNPVVIVDEPQSVEGKGASASKKAMASLNALCTLRYSATHVEKHNLVYKLDAVDAFDLELVKQIEVASFESLDYHNKAYMKLLSVDNKKSPITAKIELDCEVKGTIKRKAVTVRQGDDLSEKLSGYREVYQDYVIDDIYCEKDNEYVSFTTKPEILRIGEAVGDIDDRAIKEQQIRKTIEEHLNKELALNHRGIKVLSLFFIDKLSNYRYYDADGVRHNGIYADMFEKNYRELIQRPKYRTLFQDIDLESLPHEVHGGYFSGDKKGGNSDKEWKDTSGTTAVDESAYNLIMRDKERLLSFDSKLRFIFSHSALREGWDNPNVFQICTLNETKSEVKKRQEIGRGLRLCVNQNGERQHGFAINTLTVMANESYEQFAATLQKEYEQDEGIRFGILESHSFANIPVQQAGGATVYLGAEKSEQIYQAFKSCGYLNEKDEVTDTLKTALKTNTLQVPEDLKEHQHDIASVCKKAAGGLNIKPAEDKRRVSLNKERFLGEDFKELWERIKYKTTYHVEFDSEKLVQQCCKKMQTELNIGASKLLYTKAKVQVSEGGVDTTETQRLSVMTTDVQEQLPDIITYLQNRTGLTRKTIVKILVESKTLNLFKKNPQAYMESVAKLISSTMQLFIVDGIKYTKLGDTEFYAQELFASEELTGYLNRNMFESQRSVYDYVVYDSNVERGFAEQLENSESVKVYAKLPDWFKIPTPLGNYNPDWAVVVEDNGLDKLYFVIETKGSTESKDIRPTEDAKIKCGMKHFEELGNGAKFMRTDSFQKLAEQIV
ncbi:MAG: DEAD/DEAH box helicase family protein [Clostridiales bacterium]|nr:DEAD/DEAH box helicase family protein [Clostridiales bacterium]